jgi:hypothetical protein
MMAESPSGSGVPYFDPETGTVKMDNARYVIADSMEILTTDAASPADDEETGFSTGTDTQVTSGDGRPRIRLGFRYLVAKRIARALNAL